jgi:hypothetical protein
VLLLLLSHCWLPPMWGVTHRWICFRFLFLVDF